MQESKRHRKTGTRRWMTRDQVILKYNNADLGNSICDAKLADPEVMKHSVKPHPDDPQNKVGTRVFTFDLKYRSTLNANTSKRKPSLVCCKHMLYITKSMWDVCQPLFIIIICRYPDQALTLFLIWDAETICDEEDSVISSIFSAVDGDKKKEKGGKKSSKDKRSKKSSKNRKRRRQSPSTTESSCSTSESSSSCSDETISSESSSSSKAGLIIIIYFFVVR